MKQFVIDFRLHAKELPDLTILKGNLQNAAASLISQRLDLRIENLDSRDFEGRNKVPAILDLLPAFSAEDHRDDLGLPIYRTLVR
jgi:hypothetical protein